MKVQDKEEMSKSCLAPAELKMMGGLGKVMSVLQLASVLKRICEKKHVLG